MEDNLYKHESQGMVQISRVSGNVKEHLFGSRVATNETIRLTLRQGVLERGLNHDKTYARGKSLVELEMTPLQFAEMITNLNNGDGTPVTIRSFNGEEKQTPVYKSETEVFSEELRKEMKSVKKNLQQLTKDVYDRLAQPKALNKTEKEEIVSHLKSIEQFIGENLPYMERSFNQNMERTVQEAQMIITQTLTKEQNNIGTLEGNTVPDIFLETPKQALNIEEKKVVKLPPVFED